MKERSFVEAQGSIQFYPYRTARVADITATYTGPYVREIEAELAKTAGVEPDNHTVYDLTVDGKQSFIFFTDNKAYVGSTIIEGHW